MRKNCFACGLPIGGGVLCGSCAAELKRKGFLHMEGNKFFLPGNRIAKMTWEQEREFFDEWNGKNIEEFIKRGDIRVSEARI